LLRGAQIKTDYYLKGLDCAACAARIEGKINARPGVKNASINFLSGILSVTAEETAAIGAEEIQAIVSAIEDGVVVEPAVATDPASRHSPHAHDHEEDEHEHGSDGYSEIKSLLIRIAAGLFFLAAALYFTDKKNALAFYLLSYISGAYPLIIAAFKNIASGRLFDENFLMASATIGAFALGDFNEAVGVVIFFQVGEVFEHYSVARTRRSIRSLMGLRPDHINLLSDGAFAKRPPEDAAAGDTIQIKPGEKIALDCVVTEGEASIDSSALTGESMPKRVSPGCELLGGSVNIDGLLTARVTRPFGESTAAKILALIEESASKKAKTERFITKFAGYYTPAVVFSALALCLVPWLAFGLDFSVWLRRALIFLVISCPCALVISIPLGFFGGIGNASRRGILIKGANHLEALNNLKAVVFDKTGTITRGNFAVVDIVLESGTKEEILKYAAIAETHSSHPIAAAIKKARAEHGVPSGDPPIESYEELRGVGIKARIGGANVFVGHDRFLHDENIEHAVCVGAATTVHVVVNSKYSGYIVIADEIKPGAADTVKWLETHGIRTAMLTGDNHITAENVAKLTGISEFCADLLPHEKVEKLEYFKKKYAADGHIAFAGDGINDAPVIARADIGFAMGGLGSDAAIEAADIVLMNDSPAMIAEAVKIAAQTRAVVYQNIALALGVKGVFLIFGAFGMATMWEAVFADVGVAIMAIANSMRLTFGGNKL